MISEHERVKARLEGPGKVFAFMNTATGVVVNTYSEFGESTTFVPGERAVKVGDDWYFEKIEEVER
jgi:hypothetical protein